MQEARELRQYLVNSCVALLESLALNRDEKADWEGEACETAAGNPALVEPWAEPKAVERRVWRSAFVAAALAIIVSAIFADLKLTLGLAAGCLLALLNFRWLSISVRDILSAGTTSTPPGTIWLFLIRWIVVGAVVYVAIWSGYFNGVALLVGLFAPAVAIMIEAIYMTFKSFARGREDN